MASNKSFIIRILKIFLVLKIGLSIVENTMAFLPFFSESLEMDKKVNALLLCYTNYAVRKKCC